MTKRFWLIIILSLTSLLLTACSQEVDLWFFPDESWKVETTIEVTPGPLSSLTDWISEAAKDQFSDLPIPDELGGAVNEMMTSGSDAGMDQVVAHYGAKGIAVDWKKREVRNGAAYHLTFEGRGAASFESLLPEGMLNLNKVDEERYKLDVEIGDFNPYMGLVFKQNIRLHGRDIENANAARVRGSTATWHNPARMTATFSPTSPINFGTILLILGGIVLIVILVAVISKVGRKHCPVCGAKMPRKAEFCPECGLDVIF